MTGDATESILRPENEKSDTKHTQNQPAQNNKRPLTAKQAAFVDEYLKDNNATQAAIRAGYSAKSANKIVGRLTVNAGIVAALAVRRAEIAKKSELTVRQVLDDLEYGIRIAREKQDLAAIARLSELRGRYLSMFTDNINERQERISINVLRREDRV